MATTETVLDVALESAFATLADPIAYADWVVGAKEVRGASPDWPQVGATFHHTQGTGPFTLKDTSSVLELEPPRRLLLEVRARPWIVAHVELSLEPVGAEQTRVRMVERPVAGLVKPLWNPLLDRLMHQRNVEALRRLERVAQRQAAAGPPPPGTPTATQGGRHGQGP